MEAHMASHLTAEMRPLAGAFLLLGLCLFVERGYSGKRVQLAHVQLAERRREWPRFGRPPESSAMTVLDVLAAPPGESRTRRSGSVGGRCGRRGGPSTSASAPSSGRSTRSGCPGRSRPVASAHPASRMRKAASSRALILRRVVSRRRGLQAMSSNLHRWSGSWVRRLSLRTPGGWTPRWRRSGCRRRAATTSCA
ncbi:MAG: DUF5946 family protein [Dehalococcoidia bacterium]